MVILSRFIPYIVRKNHGWEILCHKQHLLVPCGPPKKQLGCAELATMNKDNRFLDWFCVKVLPLAIQRSDNNFADLAQQSVSLIWESCGKIRFFTESASPALGPVQSARPLGGGEIMRTLLLALPLFLCLSHYSQPRPSISVDHHYHRWPTFSVKLSRRFQNSMFIFPVCGEKRCCWVLGMGWHKWRGWGRWWKGGGEAKTGCWGQKYFLLNVLRRQNWLSEQRLYDVVGALLCHHTSTDVVHSMFCFIQIKFVSREEHLAVCVSY